jgi:ribosomal protein L37AE/L43A
MDAPKCPEHPKAKAIKARKAGTTQGVWVCLTCGKKLSEPEYMAPAQWEKMEIGAKDVGKVEK